ncbi:hypothetical protein FQT06_12830 [Enterococcus hirae]|uniref:hypothetical protein n=1 Tax=Enterococcus hirae TaxID=1354 RepID=UPI001A972AD2|nr:hypothetical protein [Enterococcus hirae]MBO1100865.1 hypothetical protein [Enterococcus hirae]
MKVNLDLFNKILGVISYIYVLLSDWVSNLSIDGFVSISSLIVGLFIPIAILLIDINSNDGETFPWDKMVLFSNVINVKQTIIGLGLITVPLLFFNISILSPVILIAYIIGLYFMLNLIKQTYYWITSKSFNKDNYRNLKRYEFLEELKNEEDKLTIWSAIWETRKSRIGMDEKKLLQHFFDHCTFVNYQNRYKLISTYLHQENNGDKIEYINFIVNNNNYEIIQSFIYKELQDVYEQSNKSEFKNYDYLVEITNMYFEFFNQCYNGSEILIYNFNENFDSFFQSVNEEILKKFFTINKNSSRFFNVIKNSKLLNTNSSLGISIPSILKYNRNVEEKKTIITAMIFEYVDSFYDKIKDLNMDEVRFLNLLIDYIFDFDLAIFFSLENFRHFYLYTIISINEVRNTNGVQIFLKKYAEESVNINETNFKIPSNEDKEFTYSYLYNVYKDKFGFLVNIETLNRFISNISLIIPNYDEKTPEKNKLKFLQKDLKKLLELERVSYIQKNCKSFN